MPQNTIMVQHSGSTENLDAFRRACRAAHRQNLRVTLVVMQPVQHLSWLGADECPIDTPLLRQVCDVYGTIARDFGVALDVLPFQYYSLHGAIADAADLIDAQEVIASLPPSPLPFVGEFRARALRKRLAEQGRTLSLVGSEPSFEAAAD
ncbi:MAG: hypothetical protein IT323_18900 [Anaerolineae bacterium]|nr:hypothetical protein [Anaerolineae bacterium]